MPADLPTRPDGNGHHSQIHRGRRAGFFEVYVARRLSVRERRGPQGPLRQGRPGRRVTGFTGIDDPYEPPGGPELVFDQRTDPLVAAKEILQQVAGAAQEGRAEALDPEVAP